MCLRGLRREDLVEHLAECPLVLDTIPHELLLPLLCLTPTELLRVLLVACLEDLLLVAQVALE